MNKLLQIIMGIYRNNIQEPIKEIFLETDVKVFTQGSLDTGLSL